MSKPPSPEEEHARACLEAHLGVEVKHLDDNTLPRLPDLEILFPGRTAYGEITALVNPRMQQLWALIRSNQKIVDTQGLLQQSWWVILTPQTPFKRLMPQLLNLLHGLEIGGFSDFRPDFAYDFSYKSKMGIALSDAERAVQELADCGVEHAFPMKSDSLPRVVLLSPNGRAGFVGDSADVITGWVADVIKLDLVQRKIAKLEDWGAPNSHLVIYAEAYTDGSWDALEALRGGGLPQEAPVLPESIDHLWLIHYEATQGLAWGRSSGWFRFDRNMRKRE